MGGESGQAAAGGEGGEGAGQGQPPLLEEPCQGTLALVVKRQKMNSQNSELPD